MRRVVALVSTVAALIHRAGVELLLSQGYFARNIFVASDAGRAVLWAITFGMCIWAALAVAQKADARRLIMVLGALAALAMLRRLASGTLPTQMGGAFALATGGWWLAILGAFAATYLFVRHERAA